MCKLNGEKRFPVKIFRLEELQFLMF